MLAALLLAGWSVGHPSARAASPDQIAARVPVAELNNKNGLAVKGYDAVAYFSDGRPVKGTANGISTNGRAPRGSSLLPEHRAAFVREPARYAPQYGGYCAYAVAQGAIVDIDPKQWKIVDGKLYLNANFLAQTLWLRDPAGHIKNGDANWRIIPAASPPKSIAMEPYVLRPSHVCFRRRGRPQSVRIALEQELSGNVAEAVAELLQVLCCGEESAVFAFERLSRHAALQEAAAACAARIAREEACHDELLGGLRLALPTPRSDGALLDRLKGFYRALGTRDAFVHLTQIYALDSGVCIVLSALRGEGRPVGRNSTLAAILGRILHDEVGHVRDSGRIARELGPRRPGTEHVARTREGLADMIFQRADALEGSWRWTRTLCGALFCAYRHGVFGRKRPAHGHRA